ncbi:MAG: hypothetical protein A3F33_02185 [Candidatus Woykebacteria bacterium RIFCSPHIGHO2_12_FULL_43_10]|uniref:Nudix hydrolase domain-containing protein n=1 Tax=Candidatus Woykebacteria bacterium RIFCSPLOWO2_01_FULL_43_14 TaxID=1802605 RepID=A0A1G1WXK5_9BACT|nr:MAG: hypothetical protein A2802_01880 [Candidatus Woykebacteria bacterium RIFCSPHIGHO2_01_FULL_43_29]OGY28772.1 MAG: hypothetical protein A3F33_02185 [Candidatus Woykebacteria bacterium RIFCSPHIGHO2_12_FULL_43_10]OGY32301.1 MAG: hypothetical protein A3A61_04420 [Candidatus Woykebacteria bacterium RIFCSPLOWO2_01_FULL_43_14]
MTIRPWTVLDRRDISPSKWFPLFVERVRLPDGTEIDYYVSQLGDVSMVMPITDKGEVVLVRQYKHGVLKVTLEFPAGRNNGEPEIGAQRELVEETGARYVSLEHVGTTCSSPSKDSIKTFGYLALGVVLGGEQKLDPTEDIEIVLVPLGKIEGMIMSGEIWCADTIVVYTLVRLKHPELFEAFG